MTKHVSRRAFLSTSAAAAAAPAFAASGPDADLLELGRQFTAARAEIEAAGVAADDAAERFAAMKPKPPRALFMRGLDFPHGIPDPVPYSGGGRWYGHPDIIADLRTKPRMKQDWSHTTEVEIQGEVHHQCGYTPWLEAQARADEIVAAYDQWLAELGTARETSGYNAAQARLIEAAGRHTDLIHEIALYRATTLVGLMLKARVAAENATDPEDIEASFEAMREEEGASETMLAMSIVRDLMRLRKES